MKQMSDGEAYELLHSTGFTVLEINRLFQLRRDYRASTPLDYARLQFIRWLVTTGRLTQDTSSEQDQALDNTPAACYPVVKEKQAMNGTSSSCQ